MDGGGEEERRISITNHHQFGELVLREARRLVTYHLDREELYSAPGPLVCLILLLFYGMLDSGVLDKRHRGTNRNEGMLACS